MQETALDVVGVTDPVSDAPVIAAMRPGCGPVIVLVLQVTERGELPQRQKARL